MFRKLFSRIPYEVFEFLAARQRGSFGGPGNDGGQGAGSILEHGTTGPFRGGLQVGLFEVHDVDLDWYFICDYTVLATPVHGIHSEAKERSARGLGGNIPLGKNGIERPVPHDYVEVDVGVIIHAAARERAAQDQADHPLVGPKASERTLQQGAMFRETI